MKYEFDISILDKKINSSQFWILIAIISFIIAFIIELFYSYHIALALIVPLFFLTGRLIREFKRKNNIIYKKCTMFFYKDTFTIEITPFSKIFNGVYSVSYSELERVEINDDGKVEFIANCRCTNTNFVGRKKFVFYMSYYDKDILLNEFKKHINLEYNKNAAN